MLVKGCLLGGEYLLCKSSWMEYWSKQMETNTMYGVGITLDMVIGAACLNSFSDISSVLSVDSIVGTSWVLHSLIFSFCLCVFSSSSMDLRLYIFYPLVLKCP